MERILCDNLYVSKDDFFAYIQIFFMEVLVYGSFTGKKLRKFMAPAIMAVHALDGVDLSVQKG